MKDQTEISFELENRGNKGPVISLIDVLRTITVLKSDILRLSQLNRFTTSVLTSTIIRNAGNCWLRLLLSVIKSSWYSKKTWIIETPISSLVIICIVRRYWTPVANLILVVSVRKSFFRFVFYLDWNYLQGIYIK